MKTVALPSTKRLTYTYDAIGQRNYLIAPTGGRFTYSYDAAQRITRVVNPEGDRTSYAYDSASRRTVKKLANGTRASFTYDNGDQLTRLVNIKSTGVTISSYTYRYDNAGNRTRVIEANGDRVTWTYDTTNQLLSERRSGASAYANTFTYDSRRNRTLKNESGTRTTTVYDAANQIRYSQAAGGRTTYTFDANGNQQVVREPSGVRATTTWDYENQPRRYNQPANLTYPIVTMSYNADNQRVQKQSSAATTKFIWDKQNYLAETDAADVVKTVYSNEPNQYGNLISTRLGTTASYHHFDALGSSRQLTDSTQAVTDTWLYDAWGNTIARTGAKGVFLQWVAAVGYYFDVETGIVWVRIRPISAPLGRWLSEDPAGYVDGPNQYLYVRNNPAIMTDPSGEEIAGPRYNPWGPPTTKPPEFPDDVTYVQRMCCWRCSGAIKLLYNRNIPYDARDFGDIEAGKIESNAMSETNVSLRHCMASAYLAREVGCLCARCIGYHREQHQYYRYLLGLSHGNAKGEAQRGENRNQVGRLIAGCPEEVPNGMMRIYPDAPTSLTNERIISECTKAWDDGRLSGYPDDFPKMDGVPPMW